MGTQFYNSFPPTRAHTSKPVAPSEALSLLQAYLLASASDPSLHPNALLTEEGPISATAGSETGLVLHNLRRVEAGLRGEHLEADLSLEKFGATSSTQKLSGRGIASPGTARALEDVPEGTFVDENMGEQGWQSKEDFEREQELVESDGEGQLAVRESRRTDNVPKVVGTGTKGNSKGMDGPLSKEDRKKAKKEKRMGEKRDREEERAKKKRKGDEE
ncbi:MAG: hypothetical protein MMC33_001531 [Icmadophila ericetorum]|nr:hypothetical protein [Icmadophila ericetorum]